MNNFQQFVVLITTPNLRSARELMCTIGRIKIYNVQTGRKYIILPLSRFKFEHFAQNTHESSNLNWDRESIK